MFVNVTPAFRKLDMWGMWLNLIQPCVKLQYAWLKRLKAVLFTSQCGKNPSLHFKLRTGPSIKLAKWNVVKDTTNQTALVDFLLLMEQD